MSGRPTVHSVNNTHPRPTQPERKKRRQNVACDACRLRRVKCDLLDLLTPPGDTRMRPLYVLLPEHPEAACSNCVNKSIRCTTERSRNPTKPNKGGRRIDAARRRLDLSPKSAFTPDELLTVPTSAQPSGTSTPGSSMVTSTIPLSPMPAPFTTPFGSSGNHNYQQLMSSSVVPSLEITVDPLNELGDPSFMPFLDLSPDATQPSSARSSVDSQNWLDPTFGLPFEGLIGLPMAPVPEMTWESLLNMSDVTGATGGTFPAPIPMTNGYTTHSSNSIGLLSASPDLSTGPSTPGDFPLTESEQDHLLRLYFSNQRLFGLEMHVPTFYESLRTPDPTKRPHPCLLNAMFLVASYASPSTSLRAREHLFFQAANDALEMAISRDKRYFDALRASTLLSMWLFSKIRTAEAGTMLAKAVQLALGCGLHMLSSNQFEAAPNSTYDQFLLRCSMMLPHPTSQTELAERIYAFWAVYLVDRCAAVSQTLPALIHVERVCTPLPLPWAEYEDLDRDLSARDETLLDLLQGHHLHTPAKLLTGIGPTVKAITLVYIASLMNLPFPKSHAPPQHNGGIQALLCDPRSPSKRVLLEKALRSFIDSLPANLMSVTPSVDGRKSISKGAAALYFLTGAAEMFMYNIDMSNEPNTLALESVRKLLGVMRIIGEEDSGDVSLFVVMIWTMMAALLIRESERLEKLGDNFASALVDADIDFIVATLHSRGERVPLAADQANDIIKWRYRRASSVVQIDDTLTQLANGDVGSAPLSSAPLSSAPLSSAGLSSAPLSSAGLTSSSLTD